MTHLMQRGGLSGAVHLFAVATAAMAIGCGNVNPYPSRSESDDGTASGTGGSTSRPGGVSTAGAAAATGGTSAGGWTASSGGQYAATGGYTGAGGTSASGGSTSAGLPGGSSSTGMPADAPNGNTNVALGGSQDFGYFRQLLMAGQVPTLDAFDAAGFFAEHHTELPEPSCGQRICLQPMLAVMGNLMNGNNCTMLQLGLNSPIVAAPANRPPLNLTVVVDVSGSMAEAGKIEFVRDGLELMIDGMLDGDKLGLVTYSDAATVSYPMDEVALNRAEIRSVVQALAPGGGTNLYGGLELGYQQAQSQYDTARQNRVIVLSDGQPTVGITGDDAIVAMSKVYNSDGIGLTSIGLGTSFNATLMRNLALQADGNFYFLENSGAVSEVFTEELSYFTVPVALNLEVTLTAGDLYDFGVARGTPFWENTEDGGSLSVPSVFLAHRESAADITDEGGRRGGGSALLIELMPKLLADDGSGTTEADVAVVDIEFDDPIAGEHVTDQVVVNYPRAPWVTEPTGFFHADNIAVIQKSFVMLNLYTGIEAACRMFHEIQDTTENVSMLRRLLAAVEDYNDEIQDPDIDYDIELVQDLVSVIESFGTPQPQPPDIPANPWPAD